MKKLTKRQAELVEQRVESFIEKGFDPEEIQRLLKDAEEEREHLWADIKEIDVNIAVYKELLEFVDYPRDEDFEETEHTVEDFCRRL